jgi:hypothetical protein
MPCKPKHGKAPFQSWGGQHPSEMRAHYRFEFLNDVWSSALANGLRTDSRPWTTSWPNGNGSKHGKNRLHLDAYDVSEIQANESQETEANIFASHLLVPEKPFCSEWDETYGLAFVDRVLKVKRIFEVSLAQYGVDPRTVVGTWLQASPSGSGRGSAWALPPVGRQLPSAPAMITR